MYSLVTERGKYLRVRRGVTKQDIIAAYSIPADGLFCGKIIKLCQPKSFCYALAGDSYESIARRECVDEGELRELNSNITIYPTLRVWLP